MRDKRVSVSYRCRMIPRLAPSRYAGRPERLGRLLPPQRARPRAREQRWPQMSSSDAPTPPPPRVFGEIAIPCYSARRWNEKRLYVSIPQNPRASRRNGESRGPEQEAIQHPTESDPCRPSPPALQLFSPTTALAAAKSDSRARQPQSRDILPYSRKLPAHCPGCPRRRSRHLVSSRLSLSSPEA